MTRNDCYFRHLGEIFGKAGIEVVRENKKEIDKIIHALVGIDYPNCPAAWKPVKTRISEDEAAFVFALKGAGKETVEQFSNFSCRSLVVLRRVVWNNALFFVIAHSPVLTELLATKA
jgi:hypothetical protein